MPRSAVVVDEGQRTSTVRIDGIGSHNAFALIEGTRKHDLAEAGDCPTVHLEYAETFTVCLAQAELEHNGRAIIQHDGVDVGGTSREILRSNIENPLRAVPTECGRRSGSLGMNYSYQMVQF